MTYFPSYRVSFAAFNALDGHQDKLDLVLSETEDTNAVVLIIRHVASPLLGHEMIYLGAFEAMWWYGIPNVKSFSALL